MGWYLSEGSIEITDNYYRVVITQTKKMSIAFFALGLFLGGVIGAGVMYLIIRKHNIVKDEDEGDDLINKGYY